MGEIKLLNYYNKADKELCMLVDGIFINLGREAAESEQSAFCNLFKLPFTYIKQYTEKERLYHYGINNITLCLLCGKVTQVTVNLDTSFIMEQSGVDDPNAFLYRSRLRFEAMPSPINFILTTNRYHYTDVQISTLVELSSEYNLDTKVIYTRTIAMRELELFRGRAEYLEINSLLFNCASSDSLHCLSSILREYFSHEKEQLSLVVDTFLYINLLNNLTLNRELLSFFSEFTGKLVLAVSIHRASANSTLDIKQCYHNLGVLVEHIPLCFNKVIEVNTKEDIVTQDKSIDYFPWMDNKTNLGTVREYLGV